MMAEGETEYILVVRAVKLIHRDFDGNPKHLREFCEGVELAHQVMRPTKYPPLLKFIEFKIAGEAKDGLLIRTERNSWEQVKVTLEEKLRGEKNIRILRGHIVHG
jgi:hypothetical protein